MPLVLIRFATRAQEALADDVHARDEIAFDAVHVQEADPVRRPHKLSTRSRTAAGWDRNGW
jgi:hypothetical protein